MEDVIVVTVNYRLHVLGFMSVPSMGISGNAGLKDQQMALEWVHENISNFGGDPNNICLFGGSIGGTCVYLHILNPKSRRLIKSAICQSGSSLVDYIIQNDWDGNLRRLAKLLGCKDVDDDRAILETLKDASIKDLYDTSGKVVTPEEWNKQNRHPWKAVIENASVDDAFITKTTFEEFLNPKFDIPIIFGTNDGDGMLRARMHIKNLKNLNNNLHWIIPDTLNVKGDDAVMFAKEIKQAYFGGQPVDMATVPKLIILFTDIICLFPQTFSNDLNLKINPNCRQYLYEFRFDGKLNVQKKLIGMELYSGASHADDVSHSYLTFIHLHDIVLFRLSISSVRHSTK